MLRKILQRGFSRVLNESTIGSNVKDARYAVKGEIVQKGEEIRIQMAKGKKYPFPKLHPCNIGDPIIHGQKTFTFNRQVMAATLYPDLMSSTLLSQDAKDRAAFYCKNTGIGGVGAYTDSSGMLFVRESVKKFLEERDNIPTGVNNIFVTNGASDAVSTLLSMVFSDVKDGVRYFN
jgi:alanine transaminase